MLMTYHLGRLVRSSLCVGDLVRMGFEWCSFCRLKHNTSMFQPAKRAPLKTQPHQISNTQRSENKATDVVIQQHSRKLLMIDILMSETC